MENSVYIEDVSKKYQNGTKALKEVNLNVEEGDFYGLIGKNGAGKTTLINVLTGQDKPDSGKMKVMGVNPVENSSKVREKVGILPEKESPMTFLKAKEYFEFVKDVRSIDDDVFKDNVETWSERLEIEHKLDSLNSNLSRGQQQKVMFISAFLHNPEMVFIDEPLANLDPQIQTKIKKYLKDYNDQGNTVILSTHYTEAALELCDKIGIMRDGKLVEEYDTDDIEDIDRIVELLSEGD